MRTLELLASDSSHLPLLFVFKESKVMEKYGFELELLVVGSAKAPTMAHRAKLALAGEIDFLSGLHHETYRNRAKGEKRLTYLGQAQNNWDDRLIANPKISTVEDLKVYDLDIGKDPAMRHIGPMEPWDLHYLRAIDDSGFIDKLYAA